MAILEDVGVIIHIQFKRAQLVATGGPWVTHECLGNKTLVYNLF